MSIDAASADAKNPVSHITENAVKGDAVDLDSPSQLETSTAQRILHVKTVAHTDLTDLVALDQRCLGGIWTIDGYGREVDSPNSDLIVLSSVVRESSLSLSNGMGTAGSSECSIVAPHAAGISSQFTAQFIGLGCLWSILEEAHITLLGVDPTYRRQGLGQLLLYVLLTSAQQRGLERATLEVRVSNQSAIALYEQFGFRRAGCRKHYYPDGEDALILWLNGIHRSDFDHRLQHWWHVIQTKLQAAGWLLIPDPNLSLTLEA
ncbi:MAG: ribosomal protein S18-alanine N-acetyltransferase [Thainema sp.]